MILVKEIIGKSKSSEQVRAFISKATQVDWPVFLIGETGVGKEVVARKIHQLSSRKGKPFIPVNCASIPLSLAESELVVGTSIKNHGFQRLMRSVGLCRLYIPSDVGRFIKQFRVSTIPQTMLINEACKIEFIKKGSLYSEDYLRIKKIIRMEV
jgi:hypothetical protein